MKKYVREADYLEVIFDQRAGNERVMQKVDAQGNVLGFSILDLTRLEGLPLDVVL